MVSSVHSIQDGRNLSDHNPLAILLDVSEIVVDCPPVPQNSSSVAWSKATPEDFCIIISKFCLLLPDNLRE